MGKTRVHQASNEEASSNKAREFGFQYGAICVALVFVFSAWWSWGKWADPLVDFGRELYTPWQLSEGKVLSTGEMRSESAGEASKHIVTLFGPLSQYFNAACFRVFGASFWALFAVNLVLAALAVAMVFTLVRRLFDEPTAVVACVVQILVFTFSQYFVISGYNFIAPYAHEAVHGAILIIAAILSWSEFLRRKTRRWLVGSGICLGLALLTKLEPALSCLACCAAIPFWLWIARKHLGRISANAFAFSGGVMSGPILGYCFLATQMSTSQALNVLAGAFSGLKHREVANLAFYKQISGFDDPATRISEMAVVLAVVLFALAILFLVGRLVQQRSSQAAPQQAWILIAAAVCIVFALRGFIAWESSARILPVVAAGALAWAGVAGLRQRRSDCKQFDARVLTVNLWAVFGLTSLLKTLLWPRLFHYGFTLSLPSFLLAIALLCYWLPRRIANSQNDRKYIQALCLGVVLVGSFSIWARANIIYSQKTVEFVSRGERVMLLDANTNLRSEVLLTLLQYLDQFVDEEETLVVLPEGISLNFYLRAESPLPYTNFMPPELMIFGEEKFLAGLKAAPPDWIVLWPKDVSEYGVGAFGSPEYGETILTWVRGNYERVHKVDGLKEGAVEVLRLTEE
ncbi:MAG: glycosyltransferase family 39 protein [Planctomycetota bacterium]